MHRWSCIAPTWSVRPAGPVFFPLDERCKLLPGQFSPHLVEAIVRLGTALPFEQVPELLVFLTGVHVSVETVRRLTEGAGAAQVAVEQAAIEQVRQALPPVPAGPEVQQISADGAMVPLIHGEWAEVRTLAVGTVQQAHATDLGYFSRLCSAHDFIDQVALPLQQQGTARAGTVVAIMDGADWLQQLVDAHAPEAVRIPGTRVRVFPHAAEYLSAAAQATFGVGTGETSAWLDTWLHELKHGHPDMVLAAVGALPAATPQARAVRDKAATYLQKRRSQIAYADFQRQGYPIGSGAVESANKLVVEARLKGSGMSTPCRSGNRRHVTPMVALRALLCSGRWDQAWPGICGQLRQQVADRRRQRRAKTRAASLPIEAAVTVGAPTPHPPRVVDGHPTEAHPWKQTYDPARRARDDPKT